MNPALTPGDVILLSFLGAAMLVLLMVTGGLTALALHTLLQRAADWREIRRDRRARRRDLETCRAIGQLDTAERTTEDPAQ